MTNLWRIFLSVVLCSSFARAEGVVIPEIKNLDSVAKELKLSQFKGQKFSRKIKIAVLDNGFNGYEAEIGKRLPKDFDKEKQFHAGPPSKADEIQNPSYHGVFMAMLITELLRLSGVEADYELHLFYAFGYTKFADAVETVIRDNFDIVSYSQVWEYGGNSDGKGYINALVDKAVAAGVIWINAAGNFGRLTRLAPVDGKVEGTDEYVVFKDSKGKASDGVKIVCQPVISSAKSKTPNKECSLRLVLAWNDFKNDSETGTDKDLDLQLLDKNGKVMVVKDAQGNDMPLVSERRQLLKADENVKQASLLPREIIEAKVPPGTYKARVKIISKNFSAGQDLLRLTASNPGIAMVNPDLDETILPPADNGGVIVVGASDDLNTSKSKKLTLPSVNLNSLVSLKDGTNTFSTSNSAAMASALAAIYLGTGTDKTRDAVLGKLKTHNKKAFEPKVKSGPAIPKEEPATPRARPRSRPRSAGSTLPDPIDQNPDPGQSRLSPSWPYGPNSLCQPGRLPRLYPTVQRVLNQGGAVPVSIRGRPAIVVSYDFNRYMGRAPRPNERIFITPGGVLFVEASAAQGLPIDHYEIVPSPVCTRH